MTINNNIGFKKKVNINNVVKQTVNTLLKLSLIQVENFITLTKYTIF